MPEIVVRTVARTHVGLVKPNNEDSFYVGSHLALVADGVGGSVAGEVASRTVVETFATFDGQVTDSEDPAELDAIATTAVERSTDSLLDQMVTDPSLDGMGTTLTAMMWSGRLIVFAQIGDSRAYYLQAGAYGASATDAHPQLRQVTKDDSFVQYLVDRGMIDQSEAPHHPRRNVILKAVNGTDVDPTFTTFAAKVGDRYLLCSDGLSDYVEPAQLLDTILRTEPEAAADQLITLSLAAGAPDNVTAIIVDIAAAVS